MFKQILENKLIGDRITNFNNASKLATQWIDKFRTSLDLNDGTTQPHAQTINLNDGNNVQFSHSESSLNETSSTSTFSETNSNFYHYNNNNNNNNNIGNGNSNIINGQHSTSSHNKNLQHGDTFKQTQQQQNHQQQDDYYNTITNSSKFNEEITTKNNGFSLTSPYHKSTMVTSFDSEAFASPKLLNKTSSTSSQHQSQSQLSHNKVLVRQATDVTCSFPLKPFQRINSETVEIPGLNVKVVRYRIEDDLGKIEPHMYIKYGTTNGVDALNATSKGKLYFSLHYNEEIQSLSVTINKAEIYLHPQQQMLMNTSNNGTSNLNDNLPPSAHKPDTYIKLQLYPDKKRKYQTRIQRKTCTPVFEETFYFYIPYQELSSKSLSLTLLDFGRFTKHTLIGSVRLNDIQTIKDLNAKDIDFVRNLLPLAEDDLELGELTLSLCYLPAAGRLTVTIVKAINLKAMDINGKSDPYVKVTLVSKGKRLKKKKTSVMKNTLNPVYNESMIFDVPQDQIEHVDMVVKVIDYDRVGSNELIGCIGIGPSFDGLGRDHYYRMLENPRKPMTQSYFLRDSTFLRDNLPAKVEKALNASDRQESMDSKGSDQ